MIFIKEESEAFLLFGYSKKKCSLINFKKTILTETIRVVFFWEKFCLKNYGFTVIQLTNVKNWNADKSKQKNKRG